MKIIKNLIDHRNDVNDSNHNGDTPLICACRNHDSEDVVNYLVRKGAKVNSCNHEGDTPLITAFKFGNFGVADYLIKNGADINAKKQ